MPELLLPRLKREIEARLAELRPVMAEVERLEAAKEALIAEAEAERAARATALAAAARTAPRTRANGSRPAARATTPATAASPAAKAEDVDERAPRGPNQTAILAVVEERPGVSVAEIASVTKIAKPTVATTVSKLKREGVLASEAGGVKLASRQPLTLTQVAAAVAPSRDDGVSDEEWEAAARRDAAA